MATVTQPPAPARVRSASTEMLRVSISRPQLSRKADYPTPAGRVALGLDRLKPALRRVRQRSRPIGSRRGGSRTCYLASDILEPILAREIIFWRPQEISATRQNICTQYGGRPFGYPPARGMYPTHRMRSRSPAEALSVIRLGG